MPRGPIPSLHGNRERAGLARLVTRPVGQMGSWTTAEQGRHARPVRGTTAPHCPRYRKGSPLADNRDLLEAGRTPAGHPTSPLRLLFPHNPRPWPMAWMTTHNRRMGCRPVGHDPHPRLRRALLAVRRYLDHQRGR